MKEKMLQILEMIKKAKIYLENKKTKITATIFTIMTLLMAFHIVEFTQEQLSAINDFFAVVFGITVFSSLVRKQ